MSDDTSVPSEAEDLKPKNHQIVPRKGLEHLRFVELAMNQVFQEQALSSRVLCSQLDIRLFTG